MSFKKQIKYQGHFLQPDKVFELNELPEFILPSNLSNLSNLSWKWFIWNLSDAGEEDGFKLMNKAIARLESEFGMLEKVVQNQSIDKKSLLIPKQ